MYTRVGTDEQYEMENGNVCKPVATLADEFGGRVQIDIDDHCYVLRLKQADGRYRTATHIFREAFEALVTLPPPNPKEPKAEKGQ